MKGNSMDSKSELRRSVFEMIKVARRLIHLKKNDPLRAGTYKIIRRRLDQLEKQLHRLKWKSGSKETIDRVANEVAQLIGDFAKSLIRYMSPPCEKWDLIRSQQGVLIYKEGSDAR